MEGVTIGRGLGWRAAEALVDGKSVGWEVSHGRRMGRCKHMQPASHGQLGAFFKRLEPRAAREQLEAANGMRAQRARLLHDMEGSRSWRSRSSPGNRVRGWLRRLGPNDLQRPPDPELHTA